MSNESWRNDLVMRAMLAIASADERLVATETEIIRRIYRQMTGRAISAIDIVRALDETSADADDLVEELEERCDEIDPATKDTLLRASYLVLMADKHVAASERKKLHDFADALEVPEIHLNALLEDLSAPTE